MGLTVLPGGLLSKETPAVINTEYIYDGGWITVSRLMGVTVLCTNWTYQGTGSRIRQYFYYDISEFGFDRYESVDPDFRQEAINMEASFIGGLGSETTPVTREEAIHLVRYYVDRNRRAGIALPGNPEEYLFITEFPESLNSYEEDVLFGKTCVPLRTQEEAVNYFLMRFFERDYPGMYYLMGEKLHQSLMSARFEMPPTELRSDLRSAISRMHDYGYMTLYSNDCYVSEDGLTAKNRSIIGDDSHYGLVVSKVKLFGNRIVDFEIEKVQFLTTLEAHLNLTHHEFVNVYKYNGPRYDFVRGFSDLSQNAMIEFQEQDVTMMIYHPTNDHVNQIHYKLYGDLMGTYFFTTNSQLIIAANTIEDMTRLEFDIGLSKLTSRLKRKGSYEFNEPVLIHFMNSDIRDFDKFLEIVQQEK